MKVIPVFNNLVVEVPDNIPSTELLDYIKQDIIDQLKSTPKGQWPPGILGLDGDSIFQKWIDDHIDGRISNLG